MPMHPIRTEQGTLACYHWRDMPPIRAFGADGICGDELYRSGTLSAPEWQRYKLWERICGLLAMDEVKCRACTHARLVEMRPPHVPVFVTLDGKIRTPVIDVTFVSNIPGEGSRTSTMTANRPDGSLLSKKDSAWVRQAQEREGGK